jgi:hypothetical protein
METDTTRDDLVRQLLASPLDRFVEERNRLVRDMRKAGDRDTAAWLASLRRPTSVVWALNHVAQGEPDALRALLDLGAELRSVQARVVRGDSDAVSRLRELGRQMQQATDDVVRRALQAMRDAGHGVTTSTALSLASMLRAVLAAGPQAASQLAAGTLLAPVEDHGFGFEQGEPMLTVLRGEARADSPTPRVDSDDTARLRAAATEALQAAEAADAEVAERQADAERAQQQLDDVRTRMRELRDDLSAAEDRAQSAAAGLREAVQRARIATRMRRRPT